MRYATRLLLCLLPGVLLPLSARAETAAQAEDDLQEWPRQIDLPEGRIVLYQPQLESFGGNQLTARAAVAVTPAGRDEPSFGAVWFKAIVDTDRDARMVSLISLDVTDAKFPNARQEDLDTLATILKRELSARSHPISLDRLLTALEAAEEVQATSADLQAAPPKIIFAKHPAILVTIDGEPALRPIEESKIMRVVNTPFLILYDPATRTYYLRGGDEWLTAAQIGGPWKTTADPPESITSLVKPEEALPDGQDETARFDRKPQVIVATEPAELIVTEGEPQYVPIGDTNLLYVNNTEGDLFMEVKSQDFFVLLAGRWFTANALTGPWSYVPSGELPQDFARIPEDSTKGSVLACVAGTPQAEDAVQESYIPQTAAIDRAKTTVKVEYEGEPQFKPIERTELRYAVNTSFTVILTKGRYYCCHEGVWFEAPSPTGPWVVCVSVPSEIYQIPSSCPVYPCTYVYVYSATPQVVYVGYTSGYVGSYVYGGVVVYGTGYHYSGWYGRSYYYPPPRTWGFGFRYNSVTGSWGVRGGYAGRHGWVTFGYRNGVFYQGWYVAGGRYGSGWWGHGGYRRADVDINVRNINIGDRNNIYSRRDNRDRLYDRPFGERLGEGTGRTRDRSVADRARSSPRTTDLSNNVFADRAGNVYRRTNEGWQKNTSSGWGRENFGFDTAQPRPSQQPASVDRSPGSGVSRGPRPAQPSRQMSPQSDLNRHYQSRQRGTARTNNYQSYQRSRPSGGMRSAPGGGGGGMRGGGGRR